ncbi:hypothetical protein O181_030778 [Austropuccinia psidii MF-1]|uniref:Uncharacterized protein n=1 Tax=Austropuccinia psidii MF-1 TaxID=1389203 RepID=A0A9Q3H3Z6_9BASI|nr:hypothetical protein [Austropuccinia psidii MF-1]
MMSLGNLPFLLLSRIVPSLSQKLLTSRDEVFKEIKDVGEEVAKSSLYLFQGGMDLPPLSFHTSLKEQWDEEEEPEEIQTFFEGIPSFLSPIFGCIIQGEGRETSSTLHL